MLGNPWNTQRNPSLRAAFSSDEPGSVIATNRFGASAAPTVCFARSKKYCLKMFGSSVLPDLLDTRNKVRPRSMRIRNAGSAPGRSSPAHAASGARFAAESLSEYLRAEARSTHAEQQHVLEPRALDVVGEVLEVHDPLQLLIDDLQPAEPVGFVCLGPQRGIGGPEPPDLSLLAPVLEGCLDVLLQLVRQLVASSN